MNKRKILLLGASLCIVATLAIGGTLAYFTDNDSKTNTFTIGKVDIKLVENFDADDAKLIPGSQTTNNIKKEVSIKLESGSEDSYVWFEQLIPAALDSTDGSTGTNNVVHMNCPGATWDKYRTKTKYWADGQTEALALEYTWDHDPETELGLDVGTEGFIRQETIDGVVYNVYLNLYHGKLSNKTGGQTETTLGMNQVYLDSKVDSDGTNYTINGEVIDYDFSQGVNIIIRAYGIQADGFDDVYAAYKAYNGLK
jgi:predicted ribosomally synthesized peptide with SipW-like signal peptide